MRYTGYGYTYITMGSGRYAGGADHADWHAAPKKINNSTDPYVDLGSSWKSIQWSGRNQN